MQLLAHGFLRLAVTVPGGQTPTPGELVQVIQSVGLTLDAIGPVLVEGSDAIIDVRTSEVEPALAALAQVGRARVVGWRWVWLKLAIGRNNGFTMNRLKKLMSDIDAGPMGRIHLNNTHTMVGMHEHRTQASLLALASVRINGRPVRHELMPYGTGPGDPSFTPGIVNT